MVDSRTRGVQVQDEYGNLFVPKRKKSKSSKNDGNMKKGHSVSHLPDLG